MRDDDRGNAERMKRVVKRRTDMGLERERAEFSRWKSTACII